MNCRVCVCVFSSQDALFNSLLEDPYLSLQLTSKSNQQVAKRCQKISS